MLKKGTIVWLPFSKYYPTGALNEAGDPWETFDLVIKDYQKGICRGDQNTGCTGNINSSIS